jgi:hypothetical protein
VIDERERVLRWIAEEMSNRRSAQSPLIERMIEVRDRYLGDVVVPVAEPDDELPLSNLTPLLIADAVEHPAMYATMASPTFTAPVVGVGKRFSEYADRRRRACGTMWDESWMDLVLARFFRHLAGYAVSALVAEPDHELRMPRITTRDPLSSYPEPKAPEDLSPIANVGFVYGRSREWMLRRYPDVMASYDFRGSGFAFGYGTNETELWDVVEWIDADRTVMAVLGPRDSFGHSWTSDPTRWARLLAWEPNPLGRCYAVAPRVVTMDRIQSQLSNLIGHADLIAKLTYLDVRATEKSIYPDRFVLAKQGQAPRLLGGKWQGGETGETNIVLDADQIGELRGTPDPNAKMTLDRVERNFRVSSGLVPQTGGETYGALRTGRGIDSLMGAALDPRAAELHKIGARYLTEINDIAMGMWASRWPARTYMVAFPGEDEQVEFEPAKHIERIAGRTTPQGRPARATRVQVEWPIPGLDDANATVVIGQMLGAGLISQRRARHMHPHVRNPLGEEQRILVEQLESLAQVMLSQRAAPNGGLTPLDVKVMIQAVMAGDSLVDALAKADEEASKRQAAQPPAPAEGQLAAPEAMPGLAMPGEGAEMGGGGMPPVIEEAPDAISNLNQLVSAMNGPVA